MTKHAFLVLCVLAAAVMSGCGDGGTGEAGAAGVGGSSGGTGGSAGSSGGTGGSGASAAQVPPTTTAKDVDDWLAKGDYKNWHCEMDEHDARPPSPHGVNRICSNDLVSEHGAGEYPVDASGVKELWDAAGGKIIGYAVYRHIKAGTTGDTWFWYEKVPTDSPIPHDADGTVAFGPGDKGPALDICVGCHMATGIDAQHSGHDFVYTQVK